MIKKTVFVLLLCILFSISTASAFGISGASFGSLKLLIDYTVTVIAEKPDLFIEAKCEERVGENS
jgi:hypothetical protein